MVSFFSKRTKSDNIVPEGGLGLFRTKAPVASNVIRDFTQSVSASADIQDAVEVPAQPQAPARRQSPAFAGLKVNTRAPASADPVPPHAAVQEEPQKAPQAEASPEPSEVKPKGFSFKKNEAPKSVKPERAPQSSSLSKNIGLWVGGCLVVVGVTGFYAFKGYQDLQGVTQQLSEMKQARLATQAEEARRLLLTSKSFSLTQSRFFAQAVARAEALWVPGTRVTLTSIEGKDTYEVFALAAGSGAEPTKGGKSVARAPVVGETPLSGIVTPVGCNLTTPITSGEQHVPKIIIECETSSSSLPSLRSR